MFRRTSSAGFSLVELMVVVAIIGVLASIAIPSLQKFTAKARQSEAKTNLASIYTANKAFYAEYNSYHTTFDVIGFRPEGQLRYNTGFGAASAVVLTTIGYTGTPLTTHISTSAYCGSGRPCTILADASGQAIPAAHTANNNDFQASAVSNIYRNTTGYNTDRWTIDENKQMANCVNQIDGVTASNTIAPCD